MPTPDNKEKIEDSLSEKQKALDKKRNELPKLKAQEQKIIEKENARREKKAEVREKKAKRKEQSSEEKALKRSKEKSFSEASLFKESEELDDMTPGYRGTVMVSSWFVTICCIQIPIVGLIILLVMSFSRKTAPSKKSFARAYLIYRILVWVITAVILFVLLRFGLSFYSNILSYVRDL